MPKPDTTPPIKIEELSRDERKALFARIRTIQVHQDYLRGYDGLYSFEIGFRPVRDPGTTAFRGQLGSGAPRVKTMQLERMRYRKK